MSRDKQVSDAKVHWLINAEWGCALSYPQFFINYEFLRGLGYY